MLAFDEAGDGARQDRPSKRGDDSGDGDLEQNRGHFLSGRRFRKGNEIDDECLKERGDPDHQKDYGKDGKRTACVAVRFREVGIVMPFDPAGVPGGSEGKPCE